MNARARVFFSIAAVCWLTLGMIDAEPFFLIVGLLHVGLLSYDNHTKKNTH